MRIRVDSHCLVTLRVDVLGSMRYRVRKLLSDRERKRENILILSSNERFITLKKNALIVREYLVSFLIVCTTELYKYIVLSK